MSGAFAWGPLAAVCSPGPQKRVGSVASFLVAPVGPVPVRVPSRPLRYRYCSKHFKFLAEVGERPAPQQGARDGALKGADGSTRGIKWCEAGARRPGALSARSGYVVFAWSSSPAGGRVCSSFVQWEC